MLAYMNDTLNPRNAYSAFGGKTGYAAIVPAGVSPLFNYFGKKNPFRYASQQ